VHHVNRAARTVQLDSDDHAALQEYWRFYEPHSASISRDVRRIAAALPEWKAILTSQSSEQLLEEDQRTLGLQRDAIVEDRWEPYLESLRATGTRYAEAGVSYSAWFDLYAVFRDAIRRQVFERADVPRPTTAEHGMHRLLDITVQQIGEAYLAEKERVVARTHEHYRVMFERSPIPMWMTDCVTSRFIAVNEAAIRHYGYSREEFSAMTIDDLRESEEIVAPSARGTSTVARRRHRTKDGTIINVEVAANNFMQSDRDVRLVLVTDVTERDRVHQKLRKSEDQLQHAQKMDAIGRLAGGVAHDFNNVLTVIESYACMLEESFGSDDARREDVAEIRRASERAAGLTRQLLTLSSHAVVEPRAIDLDEVVTKFIPMLRRLVGAQVTVVVDHAAVPPVLADPGRMEQVLMNLAVNARDAMPSGGRLTIEMQAIDLDAEDAAQRGLKAGPHVVLAVTDTGTGMDEQTQAQIFDPFFTTKDPGKGTGLGLAIVHGIVTQAGGVISAYSELGHGTTFRVYLPVSDVSVTTAEHAAIDAPRTLPLVTVLVVDDTREVRAVAVRILQEAGCQVLEAATADEARRVIVSHEAPIDVVVLDVVLADGRGDQIAHQLHELRPSIKIVLMSGYPAGALSYGGGAPRDLLTKPFSPSSLRAAVAKVADATGATIGGAPRSFRDPPLRSRVLVADDDEGVRRVMARTLQRAGFDVVEVVDGNAAIAEVEAGPFDVILCDVHMPRGGGLELMRATRRVDLDVPIILMSGSPDVSSATTAIEYGAFRYLTKPIDPNSLCKTIAHAARAHALARLRRQAFTVTGAQPGAADRVGLEVRFDKALDGLWLAYQPIVDAKTGALYGVEALVRSAEPSMSTPLALLDAAAQLSRLPQLGRKVRALSAVAVADRIDDLVLFVNLHPDDLVDAELLDPSAPLTRIASRVVLEVTERTSLRSSPELAARLARLRALGFRFAVDDIGAGYSGLTSFTEVVPEIVKIDMSLVRDIHKSALKQRTVAALCHLCRDVECLVVGEGVETLDERECLVGLGCHLLQGYLLARPSRDLP
jgi:two-component system cell cycle sensor histidine kinase/response regulator CckA